MTAAHRLAQFRVTGAAYSLFHRRRVDVPKTIRTLDRLCPFRCQAPMLWLVLAVAVAVWVGYDLLQRKHGILRNFPVLGHFRYWLELLDGQFGSKTMSDVFGQRTAVGSLPC